MVYYTCSVAIINTYFLCLLLFFVFFNLFSSLGECGIVAVHDSFFVLFAQIDCLITGRNAVLAYFLFFSVTLYFHTLVYFYLFQMCSVLNELMAYCFCLCEIKIC